MQAQFQRPGGARFACAEAVGRLLLAALFALIADRVVAEGVSLPTETKPNFVILCADSLGYGDLGCLGNPRAHTPNLDRLAAESMVFSDAYAPAPQSSPSRAALLTALWPARLRLTDYVRDPENRSVFRLYKGWTLPSQLTAIPPDAQSLPRVLKNAYYTSMHVGKWHLGEQPSSPEGLGFDRAVGYWPWSQPKSWFSPYKMESLPDGPPGEFITDRLASEAIEFIRSNAARPFLLHLGFYRPSVAPSGDLAPFSATGAEPDEETAYQAVLHALDRNVGRILSALDELGLRTNTVVVFSSDNGGVAPPSRNAPFRGGKKFFYEGGIRVPLFLNWTGVLPAGTNSALVTQMDLLPTFAELARTRAHQPIDGLSLVPLLTGADSWTNRPLFWHFPQLIYEGSQPIPPQGVVRDGRFKLILPYLEPERAELYDLEEDPSESRNLATEHPERVRALTELLCQHLRDTRALLPLQNGAPPEWFTAAPPAPR